MADVTIKYGGQTIASLSDSGSKTIETSGKWLESDITVAYEKTSGSKTVTISKSYATSAAINIVWVDASGTPQRQFGISGLSLSIECLSGSLLTITMNDGYFLDSVTNARSVHDFSLSGSWACVYVVD